MNHKKFSAPGRKWHDLLAGPKSANSQNLKRHTGRTNRPLNFWENQFTKWQKRQTTVWSALSQNQGHEKYVNPFRKWLCHLPIPFAMGIFQLDYHFHHGIIIPNLRKSGIMSFLSLLFVKSLIQNKIESCQTFFKAQLKMKNRFLANPIRKWVFSSFLPLLHLRWR